MTIGLVGRKVGMTRIFTDDGSTLPVTVLDVSDNRITQIKTPERDGYAAVQVAFGTRRANRPISQPWITIAPFCWIGPPSATSRSMLITPRRPIEARAVIRLGAPKL